MKKIEIFIIGSGGHASSCIELIESTNKFNILGIFTEDLIKYKDGYKVLGKTSEVIKLKNKCKNIVLGFGSIYDLKIRYKIFNSLLKKGFKFPIIISPSANISKFSKISYGVQIFHNCTVNANAIISENCIINNHTLIEHDVFLDRNVHVSTGVIINGSVVVKKNTFIGSGSILRENIKVEEGSFIKMGTIKKK